MRSPRRSARTVVYYTPGPSRQVDDGVGGWAYALAAAVETDEEIGRAWSAAIDTLAEELAAREEPHQG